MSWGKAIVLSFVGFAVFIAVLVTVCVRQEINLVASDYYEQELQFQNRIDQVNNTSSLAARPTVTVRADSLVLAYADLPLATDMRLKLMRPSSARYDVVLEVPNTSTRAKYPVAGMMRGRYKASFSWTLNGKQYYMETPVDL